ncbi:MAG: AraC family transcriptional regulator [Clostridiales bacterium]|nr:AraC family transcriptional regulator [Clostridiales bacterium]
MAFEIVYSDQLRSHHVHAHVHYEMLYILEGRALITIRGREYEAQAGDLVFLNQLEEHATRLLQSPYRRYYLLIPPHHLKAFHNDLQLLSVFRLHGGNFPYVLNTGDRKERFEFYFSLLKETAEKKNRDQDARFEALMTLILTEARALQPDMFMPSVEMSLLPIQEILDILDQEFSEEFSLEELAHRYHVSPGCLSSHFRRQVGMSPMQYVTQLRLTQAKRLLLQTDLSVQAIAIQCGYGDLSNFSRRFKQQFQSTPLEFRKSYRSRPSFPMEGMGKG